MTKVRHVLDISGGKDSAALAIYMKQRYPELDIEYYTCDTGKEQEETYQLIKNLEVYPGKPITRLAAAEKSTQKPFDHYLWIWLYEQHPDRFAAAMEYEKEGYTWNDERLEDMMRPERMESIKAEYIKRTARNKQKTISPYLLDILDEGEGCAACFI